jgi:hypothetical protein
MEDFPKIKLEHCPFCGSRDIALVNTHSPYYWLECQNCDCQLTEDGGHDDSLAGHKDSALAVIKNGIIELLNKYFKEESE